MTRRTTARGDRFVVVDDFFEPEELAGLRAWAATLDLEERPSVIDPGDGTAWRSSTVRVDDPTSGAPTGVASVVEAFAWSEVPWAAEDSTHVSGAVWRYPRGAALGWHNDAGRGRIGEFVCFLHGRWEADWGGELVVLDEPAEHVTLAGDGRTPSVRDFVRGSSGIATTIAPVPNRVAFLKAGTAHTIHRVDQRWSGELRTTFTGFVSQRLAADPEGARRLVRGLAS